MQIMKPITITDIPKGSDWLYEVKYDGFRCIISIDDKGNKIRLTSKNGKDLTNNFPEIVKACQQFALTKTTSLPVTLDGELVILNHPFQANFSLLQQRGRLKNEKTILEKALKRPATFMAFDVMEHKKVCLKKEPLHMRKKLLFQLLPNSERAPASPLQPVMPYEDPDTLWRLIFTFKSEGMIAKRKNSSYQAGKTHTDWFKIKNWRTILGTLTQYNPANGYFSVSIVNGKKTEEIGKCKHGLDEKSLELVKQLFFENGTKQQSTYHLPPAICASIHTLDLYKQELREPAFAQLEPHTDAAKCTKEQLAIDMVMLPDSIQVNNTDKMYWPKKGYSKAELLIYMREIAPYMLPFLADRALTLIRCPDGVEAAYFFQKHLPSYAPSFIERQEGTEEKVILCPSLEALIWFANHGAIEFHTPFQRIDSLYPCEIVFDLDPPSRDNFAWAIEAALLIKRLIDGLELQSFIKTSGNKGLQIHIPIPEASLTYDETAIFTQAIAQTIVQANPAMFTTERMKRNRNGRLYIDYVQHGKDKTLIAPYSPRKTAEATVATPLFWEEINKNLRPEQFTINTVVSRVHEYGCPFANYQEAQRHQKMDKLLQLIQC
ncbi:DNA ligase D [Virgibacillus sp. MG-45]|uniref:DNA ligase D n=1 Tax=Virgibacillus sp. MG-45 TaxID=3102791 RepID=UPI002ED82F78